METCPFISLKSITKQYTKSRKILDNFNLDIEESSFVTIIGSSGSGKTSILNLIAGFTKPEEGQILLNGIDIKDIPANQRPTATVFQDYALFSHMNVFENVAYGLKKMYTDKDNIDPGVYVKIKEKQDAANETSRKKIQFLNTKIQKYSELIEYYKDRWFCEDEKKPCFGRIKRFYIQTIKSCVTDLDYWLSYWKYYPILIQKKLKEKYLQRPLNAEEINQRVFEMIKLLGLDGYEYEDIDNLSGGTKQKVSLARSLVTKPKILLLDEPLAAIDKEMREKMQMELKRLHRMLKITFILITHDQKEALMLSDKIVVLRDGKIMQIGESDEIYDSPANPWVANFMGKANLFYGKYVDIGWVSVKGKVFQTDVKEKFNKGEDIVVMIRPEDYDIVECDQGIIAVEVLETIYKGQLWELKCSFVGETLYVENIDEVLIGKRIGLVWDPMDVHVMKYENIDNY